ncbi:MAG: hypothetical protein ACFE8U_10565 [Candidatus Hermodarchaeota archaeon]
MATKFDPKEYSKNRLLMIGSKFFPKECIKIKSGRKGYQLGESMVTLIDRAKTIVEHAQELDEVIPVSTANICRVGTTFQNIFQNLSSYQVISQVKSRSRRGYRKEIEILDFDLKKIELAFKKSPQLPVKTQKDEKYIKNTKKLHLKLLDEEKYQMVLEDVIKRRDFFVIDDSEGRKYFDSLFRLLDNYIRKNNEKKQLKTELKQLKIKNEEINARNEELIKEIPQTKNQIKLQREQAGILDIISEKERLMADSDISLFLKILTTSLDRYIRMIERRENRILEQRDDLLSLILEPTRFQGLNEELWRTIVFIIETHGFELLSSKNWFKFENSIDLKLFILRKDILEKFASLRKIEKSLEELEKQLLTNPQYFKAQRIIEEFDRNEELQNELKNDILAIKREISNLIQELQSEKEKIIALIS